jgi:hypothetical protein
MRRLLAATLLLGCNASLAQVSTMGSTAMGLSSTPGTIVTSPLSGPSPFSATTQPGTPDTTLAPLPLASDPAIPGTVVICSTPSGQITPGAPAMPAPSSSSMAGTAGMTPSPPITPTVPATSSTPATGSAMVPLTFSQQPEASSTSVFPRTTIPAPQPPTLPALPSPSIAPMPVPPPSTVRSAVSTTTTMTSSTTTMSPSSMTPAAPLGTIPTPTVITTTTGNVTPTTPLGSPSTIVCSYTPGGPPTNGAALPLSTPEIPASLSPGTIQPDITQLGGTSIDPTIAVMPTPNTSACAESATMSLATPGTMAPANATGAGATPGVSPLGC